MSSKSQLGQFFTTNYQYILAGMKIPKNKNVVEPFCGNGDLLPFMKQFTPKQIECYDIDPKHAYVSKRDTLQNGIPHPGYTNKYVITNPPYLAKNKSKGDKKVFELYKQDDLYKCFIRSFLSPTQHGSPKGGVIIVPLNLWCSVRKADAKLRQQFIEQYKIMRVNVFEEKVFDDTGYTVCSIQFKQRDCVAFASVKIPMHFYPSRDSTIIKLCKDNNYTIGGEIYKLEQTRSFKVQRATTKNKNSPGLTNISVKCIDDSATSKLGLKIVSNDDRYIDETKKLSSRSYATLVINPPISLERQKQIVDQFNAYLGKMRCKYYSLFLTNYRESNRKRISFILVFKIVNFLLKK